jgi:hypothetical protein
MNSRFHLALTAAFGFLALYLTVNGPLPAAELATDFPKLPIPLELAPRMGRPFGDNAVFQQQMQCALRECVVPLPAAGAIRAVR